MREARRSHRLEELSWPERRRHPGRPTPSSRGPEQHGRHLAVNPTTARTAVAEAAVRQAGRTRAGDPLCPPLHYGTPCTTWTSRHVDAPTETSWRGVTWSPVSAPRLPAVVAADSHGEQLSIWISCARGDEPAGPSSWWRDLFPSRWRRQSWSGSGGQADGRHVHRCELETR